MAMSAASSDKRHDELRAIPKVELHRHLECSMRLATLRDLAREIGLKVPATETELREMFLVTTPMHDLETVLNKFLLTQKVLHSEEALTRITHEVIEDAVSENIRILELRYAPTYVLADHPNLSFEKIHAAILQGIAQTAHLPIAVGLIAIIQRVVDLPAAQRVTDFAIANRDTFVGLDLADNEVGYACGPFAPLFKKARFAGLHLTAHAGEADFPGAVQSLRDTIDCLKVERIGHGVQCYRDAALMEVLRERKITLELCPTSNWLTNAVTSLKAHPFKKLLDAGIPVTINSDDPGVFGIDLHNEYEVLEREQGLDRAAFERCNDFAAAASFIPLKLKQRYWPRAIDPSLVCVPQ